MSKRAGILLNLIAPALDHPLALSASRGIWVLLPQSRLQESQRSPLCWGGPWCKCVSAGMCVFILPSACEPVCVYGCARTSPHGCVCVRTCVCVCVCAHVCVCVCVCVCVWAVQNGKVTPLIALSSLWALFQARPTLSGGLLKRWHARDFHSRSAPKVGEISCKPFH